MNEVTLGSFFRTDRTVFTTVVNEERKLVKVPPFGIPIDYSPNSGKRLGILVEQESTNHFPDSEYMGSSVQKSSNITLSNKSIVGSPNSAVFPNGHSASAYIGSNVNIDSSHVAVSFYIMQSNLQRPKLYYSSNERSVFSIYINDIEINIASADIDIQGPMNDLSYRVRVLVPTYGKKVTNIKIKNSPRSTIGFSIARIQFEPDVWTAYIETNGSPVTRPAETIYRNLTHGIDFNENQGTYDVMFSAVPNAKGSAATVLKDDWSEYMAIGHQSDENGYKEALRFHTSSTFIPIPLRYHEPSIGEKYSLVRACFSGYGARGIVRNNPYIGKLKAYDSFYNGKFNRIQFGASYDGSHFTGHIHMINAYARTFNDEEMRDLPYIPNDDSLDADYDLDESTVFSTAAAVFRTDKEALLYQNVVEPPTPQRILAAWPRASSHYVALNPDNATGNGKRWYFDPNRYSFVQPMNSGEIEQILSPIRISDYVFEATLKCDQLHGDAMGLVAAADIINGGLYSVMVVVDANWGMVRPGHMIKPFGIYLYEPSTTNSWGNFGTMLAGSNFLPYGHWHGSAVRIKITRQGPFLSVIATNWDGGEYQERSEMIVNLATLSGPAQLLGTQPSRYGFMSHSQPDSYYLDYELTSPQVIDDMKIYSQESNKYWKFVNNEWELQPITAVEDILPATRISNKVTKESFIIDSDMGELNFDRNNGVEYGEVTITLPKNTTNDISMSSLLDQLSYIEPLYMFSVYDEINLIAEQIEISDETKMRVVTEDTGGSFVILVGNEPITDGFGITEKTIAFRKVNVEVV